MKKRKEISKWNQVSKIMIGLLVLIIANLSVSAANEKGKEIAPKNQITISELEFRHMVLGQDEDSVAQKINLGQHLWSAPGWDHRYDFVIKRIPVSTGMEKLRSGEGRMLFNKKRRKN
jgi:hypothetical protein